ncbi:MAG: cbb3-type cytochrome c oxidase subunit I, partial [Gaiellaceae bacterium]
MTNVAQVHHQHIAPAPPAGRRRLTSAGWLRVLWVTPLFIGIGFALPVLIRWGAHWDPLWKGSVIITIQLVTTPLGFLVGLGGFDYWAHYASGRPTRPDDHSSHGARSWRDYFRVNTDHKVIGVQYLVTTIIFFCIGGLFAMLFRAELANPGDQYFTPQTFNVLISDHAALMIFLFV